MDGRPAQLVTEDVSHLLSEHLVAGLREGAKRDLVRHRRRRQEHGLLLAEQGSGPLLERDDGRILPLLLVPDDGIRDRAAHVGRRLRERVGAEIDHGRKVAGQAKNVSSSA